MTNDSSNDRLNRIERLVESNAKSIQALSNTVTANTESTNTAIAATQASIDGLVQTIAEFSVRNEARLNGLDNAVTGINAAIAGITTTNQRLEHILEQLLRRDQNGRSE